MHITFVTSCIERNIEYTTIFSKSACDACHFHLKYTKLSLFLFSPLQIDLLKSVSGTISTKNTVSRYKFTYSMYGISLYTGNDCKRTIIFRVVSDENVHWLSNICRMHIFCFILELLHPSQMGYCLNTATQKHK